MVLCMGLQDSAHLYDLAASNGRNKVHTVPWRPVSWLLRILRVPRCRKVISRLIQSPRPTPPIPFVVKNGAKISFKTWLLIPVPASATVKTIPFSADCQLVPSWLRKTSRPLQLREAAQYAAMHPPRWSQICLSFWQAQIGRVLSIADAKNDTQDRATEGDRNR